MDSPNQTQEYYYQNVVVMRHGDDRDRSNNSSTPATETQQWDPPLIQTGRVRAFSTGQKFRNLNGYPIHRVFVSPFLRCVQTAAEVVIAISAVDDNIDAITGDSLAIDSSKVKVSVEYGLCEKMSRIISRLEVAPKDGNLSFDISERETMLPKGTVDKNVEGVYKELPELEEPISCTKARYEQIVKDLADKHPNENLLLVTHGNGVNVVLSSFIKSAKVNGIDYCGYVELKRRIYKKDQSFSAGEFELITHPGTFMWIRPTGVDPHRPAIWKVYDRKRQGGVGKN